MRLSCSSFDEKIYEDVLIGYSIIGKLEKAGSLQFKFFLELIEQKMDDQRNVANYLDFQFGILATYSLVLDWLQSSRKYGETWKKMEKSKNYLWEEMQRKTIAYCSFLEQSKTETISAKLKRNSTYNSLESVISVTDLLTKFLMIGDHFSGSSSNLLRNFIAKLSTQFMSFYFAEKIEVNW